MRIIKNIIQLQEVLGKAKAQGKSIGFVPTMGYFHEGHGALMAQAKKDNDICVVSVYVNPAQFGPKEDFTKYPRDIKRDSTLAKNKNVDILFVPSNNGIYPKGYLTYIDVQEISQGLDGAFRPSHFKGVATIVAKLLNIVNPDVLYLGQKDAQQVAVLKAMVKDLNFKTKVTVMPTVREPDGLAMSSRNVYLTPEQRREAVVLYQALCQAKEQIHKGERSAAKIKLLVKATIKAQTRGKIQYIECVDASTLKSLKKLQGNILVALAVFFAETRLIDNVIIRLKEQS